MKTNRLFKVSFCVLFILVISMMFTGCQSGKKVNSEETMHTEITSAYTEADEHSTVSSATNATASKGNECTASAETIAECAFDSIRFRDGIFSRPVTAQLVSYADEPKRDPYGRVFTIITCTSLDEYGNYITKDICVILQSCSDSGQYTHIALNYFYTGVSLQVSNQILAANHWDEGPDYDSNNNSSNENSVSNENNGINGVPSNNNNTTGDNSSGNNVGGNNFDGNNSGSNNTTAHTHNYTEADCTTPQTCTVCGATNGSAIGHKWKEATCTAPQTCTVCGTTSGSAAGHKWQDATCTEPATCSVCKKTSGKALGHDIFITKCERCDYSNFSNLAGTYNVLSAYDGYDGERYDVKNVSISSSGVLSFTFNGKKHSITIKQTDQTYTTTSSVIFDCYTNGVKEPDAFVSVDPDCDFIELEWEYLDGCNLYFRAGL